MRVRFPARTILTLPIDDPCPAAIPVARETAMATDKERVALGSIAASAGLTAAKAAVGLLSGSLAILSEAAHSLLDFAATVLTYFAVRISGKPADREHQYGHGKVESVAALAETALLFLLSAGVTWEAAQRLLGAHGTAVEATLASFAVIAVSIVVAVFVSLAGWRLGKRTIDTLTDTAPQGVAERIASIARKVRGIVAVEQVRARPAGATLFVELAVAVSRALPLDRVAALKDEVIRAVHDEIPRAELTVTTHPRALDDETVLDRVMVIARNRGLAVHHIMVHEISGKLLIALDLEVDGQLSLGAAHDVATALEAAIAEELGAEVEVETHIEPLQAHGRDGREAQGERVAAVRAALADVARKLGPVGDIHDVRVRETPAGEIVNFHCLVDAALSVDEVHEKVDEVERGLKGRFPSIKRVIGHAEPRR